MWILGVSAYHGDSAAAIFHDGNIVAAVEEERFARIKHWAGLPVRSIQYCLQEAGITLGQVDYIAVNGDPNAQLLRKTGFLLRNRIPWRFLSERLKNRSRLLQISALLAKDFAIPVEDVRNKIRRVEHHLAHVASSFYVSPFEDAALLSVDGFGGWTSTLCAHGRGNNIQEHRRVFFPHSLGVAYTAVTQFLGFPNYGDEYKVMGLGGYGKNTYLDQCRELVQECDGLFKLNLDYFSHTCCQVRTSWENVHPVLGRLFSDKISDLFGEVRQPDSELTQIHMDIATSMQTRFEEIFITLLKTVYKITGSRNVCISGGCAMNSVACGKITTATPFKNAYIPPAPGDAGGAIGAAAYVYRSILDNYVQPHAMNPFLGPQFDNKTMRILLDKVLQEQNEKFSVEMLDEDSLYHTVAEEISRGKVVGWFQGRMEWGPRALGNRSILADPRREDMKEILNLKIKRRELFRPFAPSILKEKTAEYFEVDCDVPYMSMVFPVRPEKQRIIPAVTHADGSGRLQTVTNQQNPRYWKLIRAFEEITGVPVVLNTSFNESEPIVCTPQEAVDCFLRTEMDTLVLGNIILSRSD